MRTKRSIRPVCLLGLYDQLGDGIASPPSKKSSESVEHCWNAWPETVRAR